MTFAAGQRLTDTDLNDVGYPATVKLTRTGAALSINSATPTAVTFDTSAAASTGTSAGMVDLVFAPTKITIVEAGIYLIVASIGWAISATGVRAYIIRQNGATGLAQVGVTAATGGGNASFMTLSAIASLAVADYVELVISQDSGAPLNTNTSPVPFMAATRISA